MIYILLLILFIHYSKSSYTDELSLSSLCYIKKNFIKFYILITEFFLRKLITSFNTQYFIKSKSKIRKDNL